MIYPRHVAIIPDWNRTRAKENNKTIPEAYMISYQMGVELVKYTFTQTDIKVFTLWWLSTENASKRPKEEFDFLMNMYKLIDDDLDAILIENKVSFKWIWNPDWITLDFREYLDAKVEKTKCDSDKCFVFGVNYWWRDEILRWIKALNKNNFDFASITEDDITKSLELWNIPSIELVIRTKWDQAHRTSWFMSWRIWYAELYFTDSKCPEFWTKQFEEALSRFDKMANLRNYWK
jgi:undecaprenyl diphosphate synthase